MKSDNLNSNPRPDLDNRKKFEDDFAQYQHRIYDYALRLVRNRDTAGEMAQEIFVRYWQQLQNGTEIKSPQSWLYTATRNLCLNHIRDNGKFTGIEHLPEMSSGDLNNNGQLIRYTLDNLEDKFREVLILREYHELSYDEIADLLGSTRAAVRSLLYRARVALREEYLANNARLKP